MKKKLFLLAVAVICIASIAGGTLAYYTADTQVHNIITTDAVTIEIKEWQDNGGELEPYPTDPVPVMPGTTLSKIPEVHNLAAQSWIRAKYDVQIFGADGKEMPHTAEELAALITIPVDGEKWLTKEGDSEWLYYFEPVDEKTEPLFREVIFSGPNMTNTYQNCRIEVNVYAQAVQTANNGATVLEAKGWGTND